MKKILAASAASILVFGTLPAYADSHEQEARRYVPVQACTCDDREGKGPSHNKKGRPVGGLP